MANCSNGKISDFLKRGLDESLYLALWITRIAFFCKIKIKYPIKCLRKLFFVFSNRSLFYSKEFFFLFCSMRWETKLFLIGILCDAIFMTFLRTRWSRVKGFRYIKLLNCAQNKKVVRVWTRKKSISFRWQRWNVYPKSIWKYIFCILQLPSK